MEPPFVRGRIALASYSVISTDGIAASIRAVQYRTQMRLVDRRGKLVDHRSFASPTVYTIVMVKNAKGRWRLAYVHDTGLVK